MLDILSKRIWKDASRQTSKGMAGVITDSATAVATAITGPADTEGRVAVVIGNLQDSYQQFQYQLSAKLARWGFHKGLWQGRRTCVHTHHCNPRHIQSPHRPCGAQRAAALCSPEAH